MSVVPSFQWSIKYSQSFLANYRCHLDTKCTCSDLYAQHSIPPHPCCALDCRIGFTRTQQTQKCRFQRQKSEWANANLPVLTTTNCQVQNEGTPDIQGFIIMELIYAQTRVKCNGSHEVSTGNGKMRFMHPVRTYMKPVLTTTNPEAKQPASSPDSRHERLSCCDSSSALSVSGSELHGLAITLRLM